MLSNTYLSYANISSAAQNNPDYDSEYSRLEQWANEVSFDKCISSINVTLARLPVAEKVFERID